MSLDKVIQEYVPVSAKHPPSHFSTYNELKTLAQILATSGAGGITPDQLAANAHKLYHELHAKANVIMDQYESASEAGEPWYGEDDH